MDRYEVKNSVAMMRPANTGVQKYDRTPVTIRIASPMPPRSAPMLNTFATISNPQAGHSTQGEYRLRITPARPRPVTMPRRAHINWTAVIKGKENSAVHSPAYPYVAPATEYVEMPDGS